MATPTLAIFDKLPIEIIGKILETLDYHTLTVCKQVCRLLCDLVDNTAKLQYCIELALAGREDGHSRNDCSPADRLQKLREYQAARDQARWTQEQHVPMLHGGFWELYGGVLAQAGADGSLTFRQLPSHHHTFEEKEWTLGPGFGFNVRDFGMDPSQDLLVLIQSPRWFGSNRDHAHRFHLRTMSTGKPHPLAFKPAVISHGQEAQDEHLSFTIQICGDYLAVLFTFFDTGENELVIWEWKSGKTELIIFGDEIRTFSFLTERHVLIGLLNMSDENDDIEPSLLVLDFINGSNERCNVDEADHKHSFLYPPLRYEADPIAFEIRSDPSPSWKPNSELRVPFFTATEDRVYVISLWVRIEAIVRCVVLYAPLTTFLSCLHRPSAKTENVFDWEDWGPNGTRILMPLQMHSNVWVCYVYGSTYVSTEFPSIPHEGVPRPFIHIYDFNQLAVRRGMSEGCETRDQNLEISSIGNDGGDRTGRTLYVTTRTFFASDEVFAHEVGTSLPYRVRTFPLESAPALRCAVMCSEDNVIIVDAHVGHEYRILTF